MMPLRFAPVWWSMGMLLVAADVWFSLAPPSAGPALLPDKVAHFTMYLLLGFWFASLAQRHSLLATAGVFALGGMLELLQGLTPQRQPEWLDLAANGVGAALALGIVTFLPINFFTWLEKRLGLRTL